MHKYICANICTFYICTDRKVWYNIGVRERGVFMPVSKAQQKAVNKYMAANYDRINLTVQKGQKETIKAHAESRGESLNAFINRAIVRTMEQDKAATEEANA